jgi:putative transposase
MRDTAGAAPSVGSVGDALDKPMAEGQIRLFQTELIRRRGLGRARRRRAG